MEDVRRSPSRWRHRSAARDTAGQRDDAAARAQNVALRHQLTAANDTIAKLRAEVREPGRRMRGRESMASLRRAPPRPPYLSPPPTRRVPPQMEHMRLGGSDVSGGRRHRRPPACTLAQCDGVRVARAPPPAGTTRRWATTTGPSPRRLVPRICAYAGQRPLPRRRHHYHRRLGPLGGRRQSRHPRSHRCDRHDPRNGGA